MIGMSFCWRATAQRLASLIAVIVSLSPPGGDSPLAAYAALKSSRKALTSSSLVIVIFFYYFFGPINSAVGTLLITFTVYIIPAIAHMLTYRKASARQVLHFFRK
ncbi:hypothetical protein ACP275_10G020600 [Erythranthe tilingii]